MAKFAVVTALSLHDMTWCVNMAALVLNLAQGVLIIVVRVLVTVITRMPVTLFMRNMTGGAGNMVIEDSSPGTMSTATR